MFSPFSSCQLRPTALACAAFIAWLALPATAAAQTPVALPNVLVQSQPDYLPDAGIATKSDTPAREAPFATSTVGRTLLQDRGVTSMNEALRTVPGVAPVNGIGNFNARQRIRGFLATSQLKNGFRQQINFPVTEFQNVQTLEVLRGPASALYGRFEPGGVVNIVTKRPGVEVRELGLSLGTDGQRRATADFGGVFGGSAKSTATSGLKVLDSDSAVAYRLNTVVENSDTFRDYAGNRTVFLAPSVQVRFNAQTKLDIDAEWLQRDAAFDRGFALGNTPATAGLMLNNLPSSRFLGEPTDTFSNTSPSLSAMLTHRFADVDNNSVGIEQLRIGIAANRARSEGRYFFPAGTTPLLSPAGLLSRRNQATQDVNADATFLLEASGKANWGGVRHQWLAGLEHNQSRDTSQINRSTVNSLLNIYNPVYNAAYSPTPAVISNTEARNRTTALVLQNEISFSPAWRLTVGARSESIRSTFTDKAANVQRESGVQATTWRTGLAWMPTPEAVIFGNYSQSFSPEVSARGLVGGASPVPSRGKQVEIGARYDILPEQRLQAGVTLFDIRRSNTRVAEAALPALDRQVGESRSRGVELELSGRPIPAWQIAASITSLNASITQDTAALAGKRFAGVPERSATVWSRYDFSPALGIGAGLVRVGSRFVDPANTVSLPAFTRWDLAAYGRINSTFSWQANILNVTDKVFFENGNTTGNFYPGQPRTLRVAVNARF